MSDCEACDEAYEFQCNLCKAVFCLEHAAQHTPEECPALIDEAMPVATPGETP